MSPQAASQGRHESNPSGGRAFTAEAAYPQARSSDASRPAADVPSSRKAAKVRVAV